MYEEKCMKKRGVGKGKFRRKIKNDDDEEKKICDRSGD